MIYTPTEQASQEAVKMFSRRIRQACKIFNTHAFETRQGY